MIPDTNGKLESQKPDPETINRLIELEMAQQRMAWKQASERNKRIRAMSFLFLVLLIFGALFAGYFIYTRINERRAAAGPDAVPTASP